MLGNRWFWIAAVVAAVAAGWYLTQRLAEPALPDWVASGNGRVEAVAIDISTRTGGRISDIVVQEGQTVTRGEVLAHMDTQQLDAQLREARAQMQRGRIARDVAESGVAQAEAEHSAALAIVAQRQTEFESAERRFSRSEQLARTNAISQQTLDDDRARMAGARAALDAARAQAASAAAGMATAKARIVDAEATIEAAEAAIDRIQVEIDDSTLRSPRDGRVQYLVAQPGEVIAGGGRVLNLIDPGDVYMTFFLPTVPAGRVALGSEARIVLDTAPGVVIPAQVSFISDVAQFTPRTVETSEERVGLMFRIRVRIAPDLLRKHADYVKPGLPGMAYVKLDPAAQWPEALNTGILE
ncbi:HlyD family secretion protein [Aquamicrobium defluvii]|uniref:Glycoside hydrolase family 43 n=1 Tax=Aquamicrobium defluvii TaxID=69279 RepID=A0A011TC77_9HYPH|nr:HlyD family efflux transporter periplasmic adaptor subunit [Aquamicrobium defluvii]EXL01467.1 glycoside hydrolase family 43 [Aquamicrobium defluvii]EZQ13583.1 glycoside hydrolase family 43 [Halopseudomonas bauzanensis]TDR30950.1 HlyD family secretion protein [Aquamicrobium defluvii]